MTFFVEKKISKKSDNAYIGLFADLGYTEKLISVDRLLIAEIADMSVRDIANMKVGDRINL